VACLKRFTNIQTVSRDGSGTYRKAFDEALPYAEQISDRFHLVKNLVEAAERCLTQIVPFCIVPKRSKENLLGIRGKMTSIEKQRLEVYKGRLKVFKQVKALQAKGKNAATVSRALGLRDGMVHKYFALETLPPHGAAMAERDSMLNTYKQQIIDMIRAHCRLADIIKTLRQAGCKSADSRICGFVSKVKRDGADYTEEKFYRRDVCRLLYASAEKTRDEHLRQKVEKYVAENKEVALIINLVNEFREVLKCGNAAALDDWNLKVKAQKIQQLNNFVKYIESDLTAIKNAIIYPYSNGVAEGKINKLKTIKRQIYGRASYELLTSRLFLSDMFKQVE
jgi:transposase